MVTIFALFVMIFSPIAGNLIDRFGKLKFLYPAMILWNISGVSGCFLDSIYALLISRAFFGIATAFITTAASTLLGDYSIGDGRDKALF